MEHWAKMGIKSVSNCTKNCLSSMNKIYNYYLKAFFLSFLSRRSMNYKQQKYLGLTSLLCTTPICTLLHTVNGRTRTVYSWHLHLVPLLLSRILIKPMLSKIN